MHDPHPVPVRARVKCGLCEHEFARISMMQHGHLYCATRSRILRVRQALRMIRSQDSRDVQVRAAVPRSHAALYEMLPLCLFCCQFFEENDGPHVRHAKSMFLTFNALPTHVHQTVLPNAEVQENSSSKKQKPAGMKFKISSDDDELTQQNRCFSVLGQDKAKRRQRRNRSVPRPKSAKDLGTHSRPRSRPASAIVWDSNGRKREKSTLPHNERHSVSKQHTHRPVTCFAEKKSKHNLWNMSETQRQHDFIRKQTQQQRKNRRPCKPSKLSSAAERPSVPTRWQRQRKAGNQTAGCKTEGGDVEPQKGRRAKKTNRPFSALDHTRRIYKEPAWTDS